MKNLTDEAEPHKLLGRASLVAAGTTYAQGIALVSGLMVARVIGAADYGIFVLARSLLDITGIVTRLGLDIGLQRYFGESSGPKDGESEDQHMAARAAVLRRVRLLAAGAALLPLLALALGLGNFIETHVYRHAHLSEVLMCLALGLPFLTDIGVLGGAYRGVLKLTPSILAESILMPTVRLIGILMLFALGWRLWAVVVGTSLASFVASAFLMLRARADFPTIANARPRPWSDSLKVVNYSFVLAMAALVTTLTSSIDTLMLGRFASAQDLGQYSLVKMLVVQMGVGATAIGQGIGAMVAERYFRGDLRGMVQVMSLNARWITLVTLPLLAVFLFWGTSLTLLFGSSFQTSPEVIDLLAVSQYIFLVFAPSGWALSMTGRHVLELKILILGVVVAALLCWFAVPVYGQLGAAFATCLSVLIANTAKVLAIRRFVGDFPFGRDVFFIPLSGIALAWVSSTLVGYLALSTFWSTFCGIACFGTLYSVVAWTHLLDDAERRGLQAALARRLRGVFGRKEQAA